ncbi:calcineurin-like phosphoesterase family protein [Lacinutrix venerupis]|uniref:metallophosphoesterase n=1 Tax=Lacinutrix venerupis TaxID=1486034 RepID=UPI000EABA296|nr:metallophosphoesterase [Lacinutrix venerupis]RLJ64428.1 calcineurin-like phosphoesterase family protein [Lacinutrix venerupis]
MKYFHLKHTNLFAIGLLLCFTVSFPVIVFAQDITYPKAQKKESIVEKAFLKKKKRQIRFSGNDGPYIINDTLYRVTSESKLLVTPFFNRDSIRVKVDNIEKDTFFVPLQKEYNIPETVYNLPEKMVVISDIEGKYNAFAGFLYANKIIDENHNWIFGNGHLVLGGDFMDRGRNVTQVLWLIYKLEQQAKKQDGQVHFILGNHEILNFFGDHRYNRGKYIKAAQEISQLEDKKEAIKYLYSTRSEIGKWLATKNVIEKIGDYLFVHAGISPEILDYKLSLEQINKLVRTHFTGTENLIDEKVNFLYSLKGPFWYRGLVKRRFQYDKITPLELDRVLKFYDAKKIIIGHTPVDSITTGFNGKVIITDVNHGYIKFTGQTKGLLIENNQEFIIDDAGLKKPLAN